MRDPDRIEGTIQVLREVWEKNPDWRLGQVIANAVRQIDGRVDCDPFYVEDDAMKEALESMSQRRYL